MTRPNPHHYILTSPEMAACLKQAANEARKLGFDVKCTRGPNGHPSSYYCCRDGMVLRISNHQSSGLAWCRHDAELIIAQPRPARWSHRAILLAIADKKVPES